MLIHDVKVGIMRAPLKKPFKTAVRTATSIENVVVKINLADGTTCYGEAAPTPLITGETTESLAAGILKYIKPVIMGLDVIRDWGQITSRLHKALIHNTSAKAAVEMALWDLRAKALNLPLYRLLGGSGNAMLTDITLSVNEPEEMARDAVQAVREGFSVLKVKVGKEYKKDIIRVKAIRQAVGNDVILRLDANQGWTAKEAIMAIDNLYRYDIELVEQPVPAADITGLKKVTTHVNLPVMADESVWSAADAFAIAAVQAADMINIKLMKCGGIGEAMKILAVAEAAGLECMVGSMLECKIAVTAAHFVAATNGRITKVDLDAGYLVASDPVKGGVVYNGPQITIPDAPGLGILELDNWEEIRG